MTRLEAEPWIEMRASIRGFGVPADSFAGISVDSTRYRITTFDSDSPIDLLVKRHECSNPG